MIAMRPLTALCAVLALAACDVEQATTPQDAPAATEAVQVAAEPAVNTDVAAAAQVLANGFQDRSNVNLGAGLNIRGARAEGERLVIQMELPLAASSFTAQSARDAETVIRRDLRRGVCRSEILASFILVGGEVEVELFGRDGIQFDGFTRLVFTSC